MALSRKMRISPQLTETMDTADDAGEFGDITFEHPGDSGDERDEGDGEGEGDGERDDGEGDDDGERDDGGEGDDDGSGGGEQEPTENKSDELDESDESDASDASDQPRTEPTIELPAGAPPGLPDALKGLFATRDDGLAPHLVWLREAVVDSLCREVDDARARAECAPQPPQPTQPTQRLPARRAIAAKRNSNSNRRSEAAATGKKRKGGAADSSERRRNHDQVMHVRQITRTLGRR